MAVVYNQRGGWHWGLPVDIVNDLIDGYCEETGLERKEFRSLAGLVGLRADSLSKASRCRPGKGHRYLGHPDHPHGLACIMSTLIILKVIHNDDELYSRLLKWPEPYVSREKGIGWVMREAVRLALSSGQCAAWPIPQEPEIIVEEPIVKIQVTFISRHPVMQDLFDDADRFGEQVILQHEVTLPMLHQLLNELRKENDR
jgi:hypothetical protein